MDNQREAFITEMNRMRAALRKTKSERLRRDYGKALKRMKRELAEYDYYRQGRNA